VTFEELWVKYHAQEKTPLFQGNLVCFDPGETTGLAVFKAAATNLSLAEVDQLPTWNKQAGDLALRPLTSCFDTTKPTIVVFESYQVYDWKTEEHSWSQIPTVQIIGAIKTVCQLRQIPYYQQTAQMAKQWATDAKLEKWGLYKSGMRHARDAIRHGVYFLMFGPKKAS
jgi:hypothetical protein